MHEIAAVLDTANGPDAEHMAARRGFLKQRVEIWNAIQEGRFPASYVSAKGRKFRGAPLRTAIRCDYLLASKIALGPRYRRDPIVDLAQRELLFHVLRYREVFPNRRGKKFYCCARCTAKLDECLRAKVFRYIDNAKWQREIATDNQV
jgi:hypothetical protein